MIPFDLFQILVVGAGPAGCCAAAAAARAGVPTLLIDAKSRIGELPHCGEFVPRQLFRKLQFAEDCIVQPVDYMETHVTDLWASSGSESTSQPSSMKAPLRHTDEVTETDSPGFMINRARFDRHLARQAAAAGATVLSSTRLVGRERDYWGEYWILKYNGEEVGTQPHFVIAADGALSTVSSLLGRGRPAILTGIQIEAPLTEPLDRTFVFLDPGIIGGYGWLFPKGRLEPQPKFASAGSVRTDIEGGQPFCADSITIPGFCQPSVTTSSQDEKRSDVIDKGSFANVGIGMVPGTDPHPRRIFEAFVEMLVERGMIRPGRLARSSGTIPVSGLRTSVVRDNVIFCGDAAGLTHPITGAGVPQAVFSGRLAGVSAAAAVKTGDRKHLQDYENEIRGHYAGVLGHALAKRTLMMSRWWDDDFAAVCKQTWIAFKGYRKRVR